MASYHNLQGNLFPRTDGYGRNEARVHLEIGIRKYDVVFDDTMRLQFFKVQLDKLGALQLAHTVTSTLIATRGTLDTDLAI